MATKGNFNERYQYSLATSQTRNAINVNGRVNYCADAAERRRFDKVAATVAPLGHLAAPLQGRSAANFALSFTAASGARFHITPII
jgi:hypothetical protein